MALNYVDTFLHRSDRGSFHRDLQRNATLHAGEPPLENYHRYVLNTIL